MIRENILSICLTLIALMCFYPGISQKMMSFNLNGTVHSNLGEMQFKILNKENSILETVDELIDDDNAFVGGLILFFSVIVPLIKVLLYSLVFTFKELKTRQQIYNVLKAISKWSMADVFVVAIFIAYLSTGSMPSEAYQHVKVFGMSIDIKFLIDIHSSLGEGFYFFLGYCLCSMIGTSLLEIVEYEA